MEAARQAERVRSWLLDELRFHLRGRSDGEEIKLPDTNEIRKLCRGNMMDIWAFLTSRVLSESHATHVRQNVKVFGYSSAKHSQETARIKELRAKRDALRAQLQDTQNSIRQVESETKQLRDSVLEAEHASHMQGSTLSDMKHRQMISSSTVAHTEGLTHIIQEYDRRVRDCTDYLIQCGREGGTNGDNQTYYEVPGTDRELENGQQRALRIITSEVRDRLIQALHLSESDADQVTDPQALATELLHGTQAVANYVAHELDKSNLKPGDLVNSLAYLTASASTKLRAVTNELDLRRDASNLRYHRLDDGEIVDSVRPANPLDTVGRLLQSRQQAHVDMFMETERLKNLTIELTKTLDRLSSLRRKEDNVMAVHNARMSAQEDHENNDGNIAAGNGTENAIVLVRRLQDLELQFAKITAARDEANRLRTELDHAYRAGRRSWADARSKMRKITSYARRQEDKAQLCRNLIKENMKLRQTFNLKTQAIRQFIDDKLLSLRSTIDELADVAGNCMTREADRFHGLTLGRVRYATGVSGNRRPLVRDLAINRMSVGAVGSDALAALYQALNWPVWKASEELLPHIVRLQNQARHLLARLAREREQTERLLSNPDIRQWNNNDAIRELVQAVTAQDKDLIDKTVPQLEQCVKLSEASLESTQRVREIANDWWNQPAQHLLEDKRVDGKSVKDWLAEWKDLSAQLHRQEASGQ